jgi:hypothetical protein
MCRSKGASIFMSVALLDGETLTNTYAKIPLKTINGPSRVAKAAATGKQKYFKLSQSNPLSKESQPYCWI